MDNFEVGKTSRLANLSSLLMAVIVVLFFVCFLGQRVHKKYHEGSPKYTIRSLFNADIYTQFQRQHMKQWAWHYSQLLHTMSIYNYYFKRSERPLPTPEQAGISLRVTEVANEAITKVTSKKRSDTRVQ